MGLALSLEVVGEKVFGEDAGDEDDKGGDAVVDSGRLDNFFDGLNDNMDADGDNDQSD